MIEDIVKYNSLYDYYGRLLTENQRNSFYYYYRLDYTLAEIADEIGISKQGVSENIKRAVNELDNYENKLGLYRKNENVKGLIEQIRTNINSISNPDLANNFSSLIDMIIEELDD